MKWRVEARHAYSILKVELEPGECVAAEPGAMMVLRGDVEVETSSEGLLRGFLRILGGEAFFLSKYKCRSGRAEVWLAPSAPGDIGYQELAGGEWVVQASSYLAHHGDVEISVAWRGMRGLIAEGELLWLKLSGYGGFWFSSYGALEVLELREGESAVIDNFHFVAMPASTKWKVRKLGGWKTFLFGGEGFVLEVEGPTRVYLQTRVLPVFARLIQKYAPARS